MGASVPLARRNVLADPRIWSGFRVLEDGSFRSISEMATDPVCGMAVDREGSPHYRYEGQTDFFCSTSCRDEFAAEPERFRGRVEATT